MAFPGGLNNVAPQTFEVGSEMHVQMAQETGVLLVKSTEQRSPINEFIFTRERPFLLHPPKQGEPNRLRFRDGENLRHYGLGF